MARLGLAIAIAVMLAGPAAIAQPTGNPKGTAKPPSQGAAAKAPEGARARPADTAPAEADRGARTNPDDSRARGGHMGTPGVGTAGGLSGRDPGKTNPSTTGTTETNQAPRPASR